MPIFIQPSVDVLTLETGHVYAVEGEISTDYNHPINSSFAHLTYEVLGSVSGSNGYKVFKCTDASSGKNGLGHQDGVHGTIGFLMPPPPHRRNSPRRYQMDTVGHCPTLKLRKA